MQDCNCTVAIGGDAGMTVAKYRVTAPELMVLREIHGADAVRNIEVIGDEDIPSNEERERLASIYTKPATIVRDVLGATGPLPKTLADAGIDDEFVIATAGDEAPKARGRRKASAVQEMEVPTE